jgi:hypothetical protein
MPPEDAAVLPKRLPVAACVPPKRLPPPNAGALAAGADAALKGAAPVDVGVPNMGAAALC